MNTVDLFIKIRYKLVGILPQSTVKCSLIYEKTTLPLAAKALQLVTNISYRFPLAKPRDRKGYWPFAPDWKMKWTFLRMTASFIAMLCLLSDFDGDEI